MRATIKWAMASLVLLVAVLSVLRYLPGILADTAYPLKYKEEIVEVSEKYDLPAPLTAGLVLTESRFRLDARSPRGALGLTQVLPVTAAAVAKNIGIADFKPSLLTSDPKVSIEVGVAYLRQNFDKYRTEGCTGRQLEKPIPDEQAIQLALYHYNGGPGAVARYCAARNPNLLVRETRQFAPNVLARKEKYEEIYGEDWTGEVKPFALKPGQSVIELFNPKNLLLFLGVS